MPFLGHWYVLIIILILLALFVAGLIGIIVASNLITHRLLDRKKE